MRRRTNQRRRNAALSAALAAGGLLGATADAAPLGTNLVVNGDFENVDLASIGEYSGPQIRLWSGVAAFAYSHDGSSSNAGVVPDYADGADPPGAGHWYFSSNNSPGDIRFAADFYQEVDVSQGPTGAAIAAGTARYDMRAFMSSYLNDTDFGSVHLEFLAPGGGSLGVALMNDNDPGPNNVWNQITQQGAVPVGTSTIRVSLFGTSTSAGPDGYIDNVSMQIVPEPSSLGILGGALAALLLPRKRSRDGP